MLSTHALNWIKFIIKVGTFLHSHPFEWHEKTWSVRVRRDQWKWKISVMISFLYMCYAVGRFCQKPVALGSGTSLTQSFVMIYYCLSHVYFNTNQLNHFFKSTEVADFITKFIQFDKAYAGNTKYAQFLVLE